MRTGKGVFGMVLLAALLLAIPCKADLVTFVNLTSVVFEGNLDHSIAIDNIAANVPEPTSILLFGTVMVLAALAFRRRVGR